MMKIRDCLIDAGAKVPPHQNTKWVRGDRVRYIDPPETALMQIEDNSMIRVATGQSMPALFIGTQLGSIMEMPKGNRPDRGLTSETD